MNLYRHNENQLVYTIHRLITDLKHTNNNALAGIYAIPYLSNQGDIIHFHSKDKRECIMFVEETFTKIATLSYL